MQIRKNGIKSLNTTIKLSKKSKMTLAILTTAVIISLLSSSILMAQGQNTYINSSTENNNYLKNMGQTVFNGQYSQKDKSAYAEAIAKWGSNMLDPSFGYGNPTFGNGARVGFANGPAPVRPDILWTTGDLLMGYSGKNYSYPTIASWSGAPIGIDGQIIASGTIRLPNNTVVTSMISVNPLTGALNWYTPNPVINTRTGPTPPSNTTTISFSSTMFGFANTWKVDEKHFINNNAMWSTNGTFLWRDASMSTGDVYHVMIVAEAPAYKLFSASGSTPGQRVPASRCWDLSEPEVNKNIYNESDPYQQLSSGRSLWNYTLDEPGDVGLCYDVDHDLLFRGGYSNYGVFALNGTTGEKVWETFLPTAIGYSGCYANGRVYVGCQSTIETCLNATTGEVIWENNDGQANRAFNVWNINYAYGRVYYHDLGSGRTGAQKCYDAITGQKLWASTELHSIGYYTTVVADGKIYGEQADASTTTGRTADPAAFCCWDAFTGEIIWKLRQTSNCPIVAYGNLYLVINSVLVAFSTAAEPQGWTMWRGNADFPGITIDDAPRDFSNGPVWTYQTGAGIQSSPVVDKGKLYINSGDRNVYCLDAYNGTEIWKFRTVEPRMTHFGSTPAVYGGVVLVGPDDGNMYGLNAETGEKIWSIHMADYVSIKVNLGQHEIRSSPVVKFGYAYVADLQDTLWCVNALTGDIAWKTNIGGFMAGSVAFDDQGNLFAMTQANRAYKIKADPTSGGAILLNFSVSASGSGFFSFGYISYTPDYFNGIMYFGCTGNYLRGYNATDGTLALQASQPFVLSENSHGSLVILPGASNLLSPINQTLSAPTMRNGTVWSGIPVTYFNTTSTAQVAAYTYYRGQYTFGTTSDKVIGQAGPTIFCATLNEVNVTATVPAGGTGSGSQPIRLARAGDNIWSDWGGWEVWSSPIFASFGTNALVFYGSESFAVHCVNASNGVPLTWWTTAGPMGGSQAIYDGKLYAASAEGKVYCFEEHETASTTTTIAVDNTSPNAGTPINVNVKLTSVPTINVYEEIGQAAPIPPIPNQSLIVTFIKPDGTTVVDVPTTTDMMGNAVVQYTPDVAGNWQVVAAYNGMMNSRETYAKSASDVVSLTVGGSSATSTPSTSETPTGTATPTAVVTGTPVVTPTPSTENTPNNTLLYAGIAIVVIVVIVLAALMLMRRKK